MSVVEPQISHPRWIQTQTWPRSRKKQETKTQTKKTYKEIPTDHCFDWQMKSTLVKTMIGAKSAVLFIEGQMFISYYLVRLRKYCLVLYVGRNWYLIKFHLFKEDDCMFLGKKVIVEDGKIKRIGSSAEVTELCNSFELLAIVKSIK